MRIRCAVVSDTGTARSTNEDNYLVGTRFATNLTERECYRETLQKSNIVAVCDGLGGHQCGKEAAAMAVKSMAEYSTRLKNSRITSVEERLEHLIQEVNQDVVSIQSQNTRTGTTLAMAYFARKKIYLANVGDSRIYIFKDRELSCLSYDHNRLQELLEITRENSAEIKLKGPNGLTQYIGIDPNEFMIEPHIESIEYSDEILMICSDGLTSFVNDEEIQDIFCKYESETEERLASKLVDKALMNESKDNITCMVIKVETESVKRGKGMKQFDPHTLEPFWESWYIDSIIGEGSFGSVYRIYKEEFGQKYYSALKIISLPKSQAEAREIMLESASQNTVSEYFREVAEDIFKEIQIMEELKGKTNIVCFEDHKILPKEGEPGFHILIRMELLTSLNDYLYKNGMTTKKLLALAMDVCRALKLCSRRNIIHRDIKPANIFVTEDGDFKLGDFGIARQLEGMETGLSIKGTYSYMAPEVYAGNSYDERADIYSLGMVLYYYLNKRHAPFMDPDAPVQRYGEKKEALRRRFAGEEFPDPVYGTKEFTDIIRKACAFRPEDRYADATEFLKALAVVSNTIKDECILEPSSMNLQEGLNKSFSIDSLGGNMMQSSGDDEFNSAMKTLPEEDSVKENNEGGWQDNQQTMSNETWQTNQQGMPNGQWQEEQAMQQENHMSQQPPANDYWTTPYEEKRNNNSQNIDGQNGTSSFLGNQFADNDIIDDEDEETVIIRESNPKTDVRKSSRNETKPEKKSLNMDLIMIISVCAVAVIIIIFLAIKMQPKKKDSDRVSQNITITSEPTEMIEKETEEPSVEPTDSAEIQSKIFSTTETPTVSVVPGENKEVTLNDKGYSDYSMIENLNTVISLTMKNNNLVSVKELSVCNELTYLDLDNNSICDLDGIENLKNIVCINLANNQIKDISKIIGYESLDTLILSNNKIASISSFENMKNLRELRIDGNTDIVDISSLSSLESLNILDLSNTSVDNVECLYGLKKLQVINVQNTKLSEKEISNLISELPDCTVIQ